MTEAEYKEFLIVLSQLPISYADLEPLMQMLSKDESHALDAILFRSNRINPEDYTRWGGLLDTGYFMQFDAKNRLACFCISIEASLMRHRNEIEKSCKKYEKAQPLFLQFPQLISSIRKDELINYSEIIRHTSSHTFHIKDGRGYGVIDRRLPSAILSLIDNEYSSNPVFIRINPYLISTDKIPDHIEEAVINYPDPSWWSDLRIYNGQEKGSSYQLLNDSSDKENYWDYLVKGIRRLEFHAERRDSESPYLSMMIEELEYHNDGVDKEHDYLVGRMIHLDTDAKVGDDFKDARLLHIDLAYNYYFGDDCSIRFSQDLSRDGRVVDASVRTHILRIEGIPLNELFPISFAFFKSQTMVNEWCHFQFMDAEFDAKHRIV